MAEKLKPDLVKVTQADDRAWYAALRSAQHALDIIARGSMSAQGGRDLKALAREEGERIEQALTAIRSLSQPVEGSAGASVGPGAGDLRNGIISEVMAYARLNTRDAGELADQIMVRIAASNKGGRDGE